MGSRPAAPFRNISWWYNCEQTPQALGHWVGQSLQLYCMVTTAAGRACAGMGTTGARKEW